jgi:hypothetical protein
VTEDQIRQLFRAHRKLRGNPAAEAAYDQLNAAADAGTLSASQFLAGVEDIVRRFGGGS